MHLTASNPTFIYVFGIPQRIRKQSPWRGRELLETHQAEARIQPTRTLIVNDYQTLRYRESRRPRSNIRLIPVIESPVTKV